MLLGLLSQSNYGRFNLVLAQIIGLEGAVYVEELLDINDKAIRKNKIRQEDSSTGDGEDTTYIYFNVDRTYITKRTTITATTQKKLDEKLVDMGVLRKASVDESELCIDVLALAEILSSDTKTVKKLAASSKKKSISKPTKKEVISDNLKAHVKVTDPELRAAYFDWIDSIMDSGSLSVAALKEFGAEIDKYSDHYLDVALELLKIATVKAWRDPYWVINEYKKRHNLTGDVVSFAEKKF